MKEVVNPVSLSSNISNYCTVYEPICQPANVRENESDRVRVREKERDKVNGRHKSVCSHKTRNTCV